MLPTKSSCIALAVCFVLAGCQTTSGEKSFFFRPAVTPWDCKQNGKCEVTVTSTWCPLVPSSILRCGGSVDYDELHLVQNNTNVKILWHLPSGFEFCPALGDGVFLKDNDDGQFEDMYATDDQNGGPPHGKKKCKQQRLQHYRWTGVHSTSGGKYGYTMIFRDGYGNRYFIDPWIYND
jgi:hypothetical protein